MRSKGLILARMFYYIYNISNLTMLVILAQRLALQNSNNKHSKFGNANVGIYILVKLYYIIYYLF
jgi:hypothetical protein